MGYVVKRIADGSTVTRFDPTLIRPTSLGKLSRLIGFSLEKVEPGEFELILQVRDTLSGRAIERHEPFTVVPGEPKPAEAASAASSATP
jgi:hypothetical protein